MVEIDEAAILSRDDVMSEWKCKGKCKNTGYGVIFKEKRTGMKVVPSLTTWDEKHTLVRKSNSLKP